jgi:double-stranded uracil-DNA glycosylase
MSAGGPGRHGGRARRDRRHRGFPPVIAEGARILVLGSLPGAESLARKQYYAHPRNRFWPVVGELFGVPLDAPYPDRLEALAAAGVGLWDVLHRAAREGSLDARIARSTEDPNDIGALLEAHPGITRVALNGRKAEAAFERWIVPGLPPETLARLALHPLPSTSPANARFRLPDLLDAWGVLSEGRPVSDAPAPRSRP